MNDSYWVYDRALAIITSPADLSDNTTILNPWGRVVAGRETQHDARVGRNTWSTTPETHKLHYHNYSYFKLEYHPIYSHNPLS